MRNACEKAIIRPSEKVPAGIAKLKRPPCGVGEPDSPPSENVRLTLPESDNTVSRRRMRSETSTESESLRTHFQSMAGRLAANPEMDLPTSGPRSANVGPGPYARHVANASPSPTPNPDAMKFTLDTTLPEKLDVTSPDAAVGVPFAEAVFAAGGVASIYGVNDFVTVRRQPGCDWGPIVAVVVAAAAAHL